MKAALSTLGLALVMSTFVGCSGVSNPEAEQAALPAAEKWLALVDAEQYPESWDESAELFRGAITREDWAKMIKPVRGPLGKNTSRQLKSKKYHTSLPGAPDGEYVIFQFTSSFENKKAALETVTPMLDKDGMWRVSGYYIK
jgi:hypothetical protein